MMEETLDASHHAKNSSHTHTYAYMQPIGARLIAAGEIMTPILIEFSHFILRENMIADDRTVACSGRIKTALSSRITWV